MVAVGGEKVGKVIRLYRLRCSEAVEDQTECIVDRGCEGLGK